jgi:hypothetical protein
MEDFCQPEFLHTFNELSQLLVQRFQARLAARW